MSNEELVNAIQAGDTSLLETLWNQCEKWVRKYALRWEAAFGNRLRCDAEDLYQSGYIALCDAVVDYSPEKGMKFINYFTMYLKTAFSEVAGVRTATQRNAPEHFAVSLSTPIDNGMSDRNCVLGEMLRDDGLSSTEPEAGAILDIIEQEYQKDLKAALYEAVAALPEKNGLALTACYLQGMTQKQAAEIIGCSDHDVSRLYQQGVRQIRKSSTGAKLRRIYFNEINHYSNVGLSAWQQRGMSVQEWYVIRQEQIVEQTTGNNPV